MPYKLTNRGSSGAPTNRLAYACLRLGFILQLGSREPFGFNNLTVDLIPMAL